MSHVKNVEALARLVGFCTGYGGQYKPGHLNLQVSSMQSLLDNARSLIGEIDKAQVEFDKATNHREVAFLDARKLSTRIINALVACGAKPPTVKDARARVRKIWGKRAKPLEAIDSVPIAIGTDAPVEKTRMARGSDYSTLAANFSKLLELVSGEETYQPNEPELTVEGLATTLAALRNANQAVLETYVQLSNARTNRDQLLYESAITVYSTASAAKCYVKSAFGADSKQYKEVGKVRLSKPAA